MKQFKKQSKFYFALTFLLAMSFSPVLAQIGARPWSDEVLYFVLIDRFADGKTENNIEVDPSQKGYFHGGDLVGLTEKLDYLQELGITAIWINPIVKNMDTFVDAVGFPDWAYHGYWADDFYKLDERFGTETEFYDFVNAAHAKGIRILLDVVYNHPGYKSQFLKWPNANDWMRTGRRESLCGDDDLTTCLSGLPDFKTEKPEVADYLLKAHLGWAKKSGVDGFRLDTVKHVDRPFWQEHRKRIRAELPKSFFLLGEVWGADYKVMDDYFEPDEMDAGFDFSFKGSAMSFVLGRGRTIAFSRYLMKRHKIREGYQMAHYLASHDEKGTLFELKNNKTLFKMCVALQMTSLGIPVIYYGEEVGRIGGDWPDNRSDMPWGEEATMPGKGKKQDLEMLAYYKKLIAIRKAYPSLSRGDFQEVHTDGDCLIFSRNTEDETVFVAVNRASEPFEATIVLPDHLKLGVHMELMTGKPVPTRDGSLKTIIPGRQAVLIGSKPIAK